MQEQNNILTYSYFQRIVGTWNFLPEYIRRTASVNSFKVLAKKCFHGLANSLVFLILCHYSLKYLL